MNLYLVQVQHPAIELADGTVIPNFKFVGHCYGKDDEDALRNAQALHRDQHSANLITVQRVED